MAALILVSFWDRFWEAQCAANAALAVSKRQFAVFEKMDFGFSFGLHFRAFGLIFDPWSSILDPVGSIFDILGSILDF